MVDGSHTKTIEGIKPTRVANYDRNRKRKRKSLLSKRTKTAKELSIHINYSPYSTELTFVNLKRLLSFLSIYPI